MAVTSTNFNPKNDSKYARHRSIWKGKHNQLRDAIAKLQGVGGLHVHVYDGRIGTVTHEFNAEWGVRFHTVRQYPIDRKQVLCYWGDIDEVSDKMLAVLNTKLQSDLRLIWSDFIVVGARRIGSSDGSGYMKDDPYSGSTVIVFAYGPNSFDLIVSKYGYAETQKKDHKFYHWQARTKGVHGLVNVDDFTPNPLYEG